MLQVRGGTGKPGRITILDRTEGEGKEGNLTPTQPWEKVRWFKVRRGWILGIHSPRKWHLGKSYNGLPLGRGV